MIFDIALWQNVCQLFALDLFVILHIVCVLVFIFLNIICVSVA